MERNDLLPYTNWKNNTIAAKLTTNKKYLILKLGENIISTGGFGVYVVCMLNGIRFAVDNGYIPVIDWQNCRMRQYDPAKIGKENVWEYFFEQPFHVSIEQAYASEDCFVIDQAENFAFEYNVTSAKFENFNDEGLVVWRKYFQNYIRLRKEIREYFDRYSESEKLDFSNTIGVLARGTDYKNKPVGHYSPVSLDEIFEQIRRLDGVKRIFLATEDKGIVADFENKYPGKIDSVDSKRYEIAENGILLADMQKGDCAYERDLKYLYSLYFISKCPVCICAACTGSILVSLLRREKGSCYRFLNNGVNRPAGIIVGSYIEKKYGRIVQMADKPIMFYALNACKLSGVMEVDVIVSSAVKAEYEKLIGCGEAYGIKIHYFISETYDIADYMVNHLRFKEISRLVLLYSDYFVHGNKIASELFEKAYQLDGAYVWGVNRYYSDNMSSIRINKITGIPQEVHKSHQKGCHSLMGKYVFDYDVKDILEQVYEEKKEFSLIDILNEYIKREKLFFIEYSRGTIFTYLKDDNTLKKTGRIIELLEELQGKKIGDFAAFRK